ncbi:hypothetical protein H103_08894 [Trichophyton rubrum CBS 288.86]|nr:hypothetical protein H100_08914 [Trichophyton rubrum MR850]EZF36604.1 hypothetical protein H102_08874 [Trichophyton rubrum CBS 100081]EZF47248.1 hypothetical protein H103_08894 [Trichophyton rubrum CBS 288.86]EZF57907.1 hypothetical protein H104_08845 [Trichophyton rubrum CBS 289.86]EZF79075.1 hypothetical protein H110_08897 [Trichophyton rubrum MR1448]EZG11403.1 hypothetical protein H107_09052 [Trichophyton rubrum CBS 202.88]
MASNDICASVQDRTFGPWAQQCRGAFDFTLLFEESVLTLVPLCIMILFAPFRIAYLFRKKRKVEDTPLVHMKITSLAAYCGLQLLLVILWTRPDVTRTQLSIAVNVLTLVGSILFILLSYAEHLYTTTPSLMLNVFMFFTLLFDVARARTLWLRDANGTGQIIAWGFTATVALKFVILLLEVTEKRFMLKAEYKSYPPEATAGIFNRSFFVWLNALFWDGFSKLLFVEDLYELDKHLLSERIHQRMNDAWEKVKSKTPNSLLMVTFKTLKWPILSIAFPRLCLIGFLFAQPFLLNKAILLASEPITDDTTNQGYGLIFAYVIVYVGLAVAMGQYQHLTYRAITMVRGGLISMLYRKATDINIQDVDPASSMTLMSADIERIVQGWQTMHELWAAAAEVGIAIFLLQKQLGVACVVPIAVSILSLFGSVIAMNFVMAHQASWLEAIERRISATSVMLSSMKGVKMCGLKEVLLTNLHNLRLEELNISKKFRKLLIWNMGFAFVSQIFGPIITFAVFAAINKNGGGNAILDISRVFTSLSLFALLSEPLQSLIMSLVTFLGSVGCFTRIQEFLDKPSRVDSRRQPEQRITNLFNLSQQTLALSDKDASKNGEKVNRSSASPTIKSTKSGASFPLKGLTHSNPEVDAVAIRDGCFAWENEKGAVLKSININIPRSKTTVIVGPVGCGKSTLLKAILGEVVCLAGVVEVASMNIAFCDQTAWHMNESIKDSIVSVLDLDEKWYATVVRACGLAQDLRQLPRGDQTIVGSKGIALSGGQSQRIALARAIYAQKDVLILDDVLSGIDAATENHIFHSLLGEEGLLRRLGTTVIITSSSPKRIPYADHIIALSSDGRIDEQGKFEELNVSGGYVSSFNLPSPDWLFKPEPERPLPAPAVVDETPQTSDELEAAANRRMGDMAIYLYYARSIGWPTTIVFMFFISAFVFCISFPTIWLKWWAASNIEAPYEKLGYYLGIYVMLGVLAIISLILGSWQMIITMVPKSGEAFHFTLLKTVLSAPLSFFSTTDQGVTMNRFSQDLQLIDMELPVAALNTFATFVLCFAQMVIIGVASVYAAIAFPLIIGTLYMIQKYYLRTSRQLRFMDLEAKAPLYSQFTECLNGLATIRAFGWQEALEKKNRKLLDRSQKPFYLLFSVQRWLTLVLDMVVAGIAVLLIVLVIKLRGTISGGYAGVALLNVIQFSQSIKLLITFWTTLETHIGAIARIKVFNETAQPEDKEGENTQPPDNWPAQGGIEFKSVSAEYRPGEPILKNVTLTVAPGEKLGICGRTGSGKSSLILTIFRMLELSGGSISIDGIDLSTLPRSEIRSRITGVSQDALILKGSLRLNVDPTGVLSDDAMISALKSVQLWNIVNEKGGLDVDIDEFHLSHGQKQLLCLARAILRPSTILILDEATSK